MLLKSEKGRVQDREGEVGEKNHTGTLRRMFDKDK